ncbi:hypothetical protein [Lentzea sp. NPDC059081]|uniref:hypothetical protein n=1 Tax=Lentzea sp. NPDC059081 TaxID=3346719 RepID=UPI0036C36418
MNVHHETSGLVVAPLARALDTPADRITPDDRFAHLLADDRLEVGECAMPVGTEATASTWWSNASQRADRAGPLRCIRNR